MTFYTKELTPISPTTSNRDDAPWVKNKQICIVCLDDFDTKAMIALLHGINIDEPGDIINFANNYNHYLCYDCTIRLLNINITLACPTCRRVVHINNIKIYDNIRHIYINEPLVQDLQNANVQRQVNIEVESLWRTNKQLTTIPSDIIHFEYLTDLNLSYNQLTDISDLSYKLRCTNIRQLDLSYNQLTSLPAVFGELVNIKELNLSNNQLITLPEQIGQLVNMDWLDLSNNNLDCLPTDIKELLYLQELNLSNNKFNSLPLEICKLPCLTNLDLSNNNLDCLPVEIKTLRWLKYLNLSNNKFKQLPPIPPHDLHWLNLSNNCLRYLSADIGELVHLRELNLSNNQLTELPVQMNQLVNLEELRNTSFTIYKE